MAAPYFSQQQTTGHAAETGAALPAAPSLHARYEQFVGLDSFLDESSLAGARSRAGDRAQFRARGATPAPATARVRPR